MVPLKREDFLFDGPKHARAWGDQFAHKLGSRLSGKFEHEEEIVNWSKGDFDISNNRRRLDLDTIYEFLSNQSEWAKGIPRAVLEKSISCSLCFGVFHGTRQVGFARVISDCATIAYLGDVFVLPEYRGCGLAKWLMECIITHPDLQNLRRWILVTEDAHGLYGKYGFKQLAHPESFMELHDPNVYKPGIRGTV